jgi:DNA-binding transcriptional MerR regulator
MSRGRFIGDVAKQVGLSVKTIRYYEGLGLLSEPERTDSGYRVYSEADLERLSFIKGAKALGLTLAEIRETLAMWVDGVRPCGHVQHLLEEKVAELTQRIDAMTTFRDELVRYLQQQEARPTPADVPCKHIAGAAHGLWDLAPPPADLHTERKSTGGCCH